MYTCRYVQVDSSVYIHKDSLQSCCLLVVFCLFTKITPQLLNNKENKHTQRTQLFK